MIQTHAAAAAVDTDWANFALGNETYEAEGGTFVRNPRCPDIYDANHVAHISASTPAEIDRLLERVERDFADCNHRRFETDFRTPPEFIARLTLDGYSREEGLLLLLEGDLRGKPAHGEDIRPVESEADWAALSVLHALDWKEARERDKHPPLEDVERQMFASQRMKQPPVQYWIAWRDGRAAGFFNSWAGVNGVGQVENLFTHPDYRNQGVATALIHHCVADARARGAGPIVIAADPTDTPKNIYARMGFLPVAVVGHYLRRLTPEAGTEAA